MPATPTSGTRSEHLHLHNVARRAASIAHHTASALLPRDSSDDCDPDERSCKKPTMTGITRTLPIVLCVAVPAIGALICFIWMHRRNVKRQRAEDLNDPHKSLDFGTGLGKGGKGGKGGKLGVPEMTVTDMADPSRHGKKPNGLSMDMNLGSPYLLPGATNGSGASIHSMSRSLQDQHDPYRPVAFGKAESPRPWNGDNGSVYSMATNNTGEHSNLLANASRMSQAYLPKRGDSMASPHDSQHSDDVPLRQMHSISSKSNPSRKASLGSTEQTLSNIPEIKLPRQDSLSRSPSPDELISPPPSALAAPIPPQDKSKPVPPPISVDRPVSDSSVYEEDQQFPAPPKITEPDNEPYDIDPSMIDAGRASVDGLNGRQSLAVGNRGSVAANRVSVMGLRPLPPDANPEENAEQRANRIRSFYKEYFDDSKGVAYPVAIPEEGYGGYYEDYDAGYLDGAIYDPETGGYSMANPAPYAQPMPRRAMTPPPRSGPRFPGAGPHRRQMSTMSGAGPGPRGRPPFAPKKALPPPKALTSLPTPAKLAMNDDGLIANPIDFAPPTSMRDLQNGRRPDSPLGVPRPYSPSVRSHSPLVGAFEELPAMPSPHLLRKSGTFTALDFAAPPKFRGQEGGGSDAGSIRSARSGISPMQENAVRAGAYRVSRIPKEMVTSKDDLSNQLRPRMNLTTPG